PRSLSICSSHASCMSDKSPHFDPREQKTNRFVFFQLCQGLSHKACKQTKAFEINIGAPKNSGGIHGESPSKLTVDTDIVWQKPSLLRSVLNLFFSNKLEFDISEISILKKFLRECS